MGGVKLTAGEAYERGLVTRVYPRSEFQQKLTENARHIASLPPMVYIIVFGGVFELATFDTHAHPHTELHTQLDPMIRKGLLCRT